MKPAIYWGEETAYLAASYIRGPQIKRVFVKRNNFERYTIIIEWLDGSESVVGQWLMDWFVNYKEI